MGLKKIHIRNFKSLVDFKLGNLKSFCAFVGPNASGKSNIFVDELNKEYDDWKQGKVNGYSIEEVKEFMKEQKAKRRGSDL